MDYTTIYNEVINLTNRPDLADETRLAIQKTTAKLHQLDFWYKDLDEVVIGNLPQDYKFSLDIPSNFARFRAFNYLRMLDANNNPQEELELISPKQVFDSFQQERTNVFYVGGMSLNCRLANTRPAMIVGYYQYPDVGVATGGVGTTTFSSWIANEYPYAIIEEAAAQVFRTIGYADAANSYGQQIVINLQILRQNNILEQVR